MIKATCIIPTGDGCSAICPVDGTFRLDEEAVLSYKYEADGLLAEFSGLAVKIPSAMFDYLQETLFEDEGLGGVTNLHLYGKADEYRAFFIITLPLQAEEFIKAKGVAEYLASNPR